MRLCFISNPNSIHTRRWVNWFAIHGYSVCLIADNRLQHPWENVLVYDLPARFGLSELKYLVWIKWTRRIISHWRPDIVHAHRVNGAGWLGALSGFHPFVVTPWGTDLYVHPYRSHLARLLARYTLAHADLVTADSTDLGKQAMRFGSTQVKTHVVQWGVDTTVFNLGVQNAALRAQLQPRNAPVLLSQRATAPIYNIENILQALSLVRLRHPETILILRDYNTDSTYKKRLDKHITEQELNPAIRWVGNLERHEDIADLYGAADIAISVPSSDGTPVSVLEAMACGAAPIVSDLPSLREWITDGENGLLVPVGDAKALAEAIMKLLRTPQLREQFSRRNQEIIQTRANQTVEMGKMEALYQWLSQSQQKRSA